MKWTDADLDLTLQALSQEDPPDAALAHVRELVLDQTQPRLRWWWAWLAVPALASALWFVWTPAQLAPPPLIANAPPVVDLPVVRAGAPPVRTRSRPSPPSPRLEPVNDGEYVKIATADPNVVILWKLENEGETR